MLYDRCSDLESRNIWRLLAESFIFFFTPAVVTGVLYYRISRNLLSQEKRVTRNRVLSLTFGLSWIAWVLCWTPSYVIGFLQLQHKRSRITWGLQMDQFLFRLVALKAPLQLLYSHLNPIIFVCLLKPLADMHADVLSKIMTISIVDKIVIDTKKPESNPEPSSDPISRTRGVLFVCLCISTTVLLIFGGFWIFLEAGKSSTETKNHFMSLSKHSAHSRSHHMFSQLSWQESFTRGISEDNPRFLCSKNHGTYNWELKRCYFLVRHNDLGLSFEQQTTECLAKGSVLSYPRIEKEVAYLWEFFENNLKSELSVKQLANISIRTGLRRQEDCIFNCGYESGDLKFVISPWNVPSWFRVPLPLGILATREKKLIHELNVCIRRNRKVYDCSDETLSPFSICSVDLVENNIIS